MPLGDSAGTEQLRCLSRSGGGFLPSSFPAGAGRQPELHQAGITHQPLHLRINQDPAQQDFHGDTAPMSGDALQKVGTAYKVYSALYPALRGWTLLDKLIPFNPGYMMVAWGKKAADAA